MKKYLCAALFCLSFIAIGQYHEAKLEMQNGEIKNGYAKLPSNALLINSIKFKTDENGSRQKIKEKEIKNILYTSHSGTQLFFERKRIVKITNLLGKEHRREKNHKYWVLLNYTNSVMSTHTLAQRYKLEGDLVTLINGNYSPFETIYYLCKRTTENEVYIISGRDYGNGFKRTAMAFYFKDVPNFVERIENKEFDKINLKKIADEYETYFE